MDNTTLSTGAGGDVIATDDIGGGVKVSRSKIMLGADGVNDGDVSSANPMPVSMASVPSHAVTNAGTFAVQSTIAAGATNIAKAEDVASANADVGVPAMAIQKATPADTAGADGDYAMLQMSAGRLWVDPSGVTLTVASHAVTNAGTFATQATQAGTWNVGTVTTVTTLSTITNVVHIDDNNGSITVDNGGTFAVQAAQSGAWNVTNVSGTISLPTGASTAAKQPALGTAGSASSDVITVQGVSSMTPLLATLSGTNNIATVTAVTTLGTITNVVHVDDNSGSLTIDAPVGTPAFVRLSDGSAAITTLPVSLASVPSHAVTNAGTFAVQEADGANTTLGSKADAKSTATDTTSITVMSVLKQISASVQAPPSQAVTNAGTFATQAAQSGTWNVTNVSGTVSLPTGASTSAKQPALGTAGSASADVITVQGVSSMTPLLATLSGTNNIATVTTVTAVTAISNALPAGTNAIGDVGLKPRTSGGLTIFRSISVINSTLQIVKASAGQVYWIHAMNMATTPRYLKFYNAASGTIGTGTPVLTIPIPSHGDANGAGTQINIPAGLAFGTGICVGASTAVADADTGAPSANDVIVNVGYA